MVRTVGTTIRGIRAPIIKEGDDLVHIVVDSVLQAARAEQFQLNDRDVIGVTESLVARAQGNFASIDHISEQINELYEGDDLAVLFPILSRNRFALILKGIAQTGKTVHLFLNYPCDEVGNHLMDVDLLDEFEISPHSDVLTEGKYRELFGENIAHPFTGIDYVAMYKSLGINDNIKIYLANDARAALNYSKHILIANVHDRQRTRRVLEKAGAETVYGLDDLLREPINGSGYNPEYGIMGSNAATETKLKLFPRDCQPFVDAVQKRLYEVSGKQIEVLVYGDGAFKDPAGKIWELADPVVSPGYTAGLEGTPSEIKLKYVADGELSDLSGEEMADAIRQKIRDKNELDSIDDNALHLGTTPRQITDLLGSLCDLTSGSGDKGTPIVLVQNYFDNYASE